MTLVSDRKRAILERRYMDLHDKIRYKVRKRDMKKEIFVILTILLTTVSIGCFERDDDFKGSYSHKYELFVTPNNLNNSSTKEYSIMVNFKIPRDDPYLYFNLTTFYGDCDRDIISKWGSSWLLLSSSNLNRIGFSLRYTGKNHYDEFESSWTIDVNTFGLWYSGNYNSLYVEYYEELNANYDNSGEITTASAIQNITDEGWNYVNVTYNSENWID